MPKENEGKPLKNISISINNKTQKGEIVITKFGIEGAEGPEGAETPKEDSKEDSKE